MIITCLLQNENDKKSGHLDRFLELNSEIMDNLVVFDNNSSDGSQNLLSKFGAKILQEDFSAFPSEQESLRRLHDFALQCFPNTDWFIKLDADEILFTSRPELESLVIDAENENFDSLRFGLTNLWRSEAYFRLDSGFNDLRKIAMWKNSSGLQFSTLPGLHQPMNPINLKKTKHLNLKICHFGFASDEYVSEKFNNYKRLGQRGKALWWLIDEKNRVLESVYESKEISLLGSRAIKYFFDKNQELPQERKIEDYFWEYRLSTQDTEKNPFVTIVCLIYQGVDWLEFQYKELIKLQDELSPGEVGIIFVANNPTRQVIEFLRGNSIPHILVENPEDLNEWYINSVYRGYNKGAGTSVSEYLLFVNSDMAYQPGFLYKMLQNRDPNSYLVSRLVESGRLLSGHLGISKNFGRNLASFNHNAYINYAKSIATDSIENGGLYMPALVKRSVFQKLGGFPEGNLKPESLEGYVNSLSLPIYAKKGESIIPGDVSFIGKAERNGVTHKTTYSTSCYHFQEGEKSNKSIWKTRSKSGFLIVNDTLTGHMGEVTLWNKLVDILSQKQIHVRSVPLGHYGKLPYIFRFPEITLKRKERILFRNSTYLRKIVGNYYEIGLTQDRLSGNRKLRNQTRSRQALQAEIVNSKEFINDTPNLGNQIWLTLPVNEIWWDKPLKLRDVGRLRKKAIFVGAFNDTKGWPEVRSLVESNPNIDFIIVSKYMDDDHGLSATLENNWRIFRAISQESLLDLIDESDFFLLGSPFETQCLAAIESAMRDRPVLMKSTGILSTLPEVDRQKIGVFSDDLFNGLKTMLQGLDSGKFSPREVLERYDFSPINELERWATFLSLELKNSFRPINQMQKLRKYIPEFAYRITSTNNRKLIAETLSRVRKPRRAKGFSRT